MKLSIDLGGTNIRIGVINQGVVVKSCAEPSLTAGTMEDTLQQIECLIHQFDDYPITSLGIGVPSVVDAVAGIVYNATNIPSWSEVHLKTYLEQRFSFPVYVNNDANCFTLGVHQFGEGKGYQNVVGVTLGTGVGLGVIVNNKLYNGANTGAGELGSLPYKEATLEDYCGSHFFEQFNTTGLELFKQAELGEKTAIELWKEFGTHLGYLVQLLLYAYDPEVIIFGGGLTAASAYFMPSLYDDLTHFPYPTTVKKLKIMTSQTKNVSLLGASALLNPVTL